MDHDDSPEQGRRSHAHAAFLQPPGIAGRSARATTVLAMVALVTVVGTASAQNAKGGGKKAPSGPASRVQSPTPPPPLPPPPAAPEFRSFDGSGNNPAHPEWGSAGTDYLRERSGAHYADGKSAPAGGNRPSARAISNAVVAQGDAVTQDARGLSTALYEFGQFLDHDIGLAAGAQAEAFPVSVPSGDPWFDPAATGSKLISMFRSAFDPATGTTNARQQVNSVTSFIDGSQIYGVSAARVAWLREGAGGRLKVRRTDDGVMLPLNDGSQANDDPLGNPPTSLVVAGDVRANEQPGLTSFHTVFLREHNLQAARAAARHPEWDDERLFQEARRVVIAELQSITVNEFVPAMLGSPLPAYKGYRNTVNPGLSNVFATAAYRNGHSMVGPDIGVLDANFVEVASLPLQDIFFNPGVIASVHGIDPFLRYFASDIQQETDTKIVDPLRNFLFGPPGSGGFDLGALNIQRGRDHGLPDYNTVRQDFGLRPVRNFSEITSNATLAASLASLYGSVNNIDAWVGLLAEDHVPGSSLGPTSMAVLRDQFTRLRDGDRFWYRNGGFDQRQVAEIEATRLSDILMRNSGVVGLQRNVFFAVVPGTP
jgi:peroxidase